MDLYDTDLARIHIDGYGFHWQSAAPALEQWLRDAGIRTGEVVDLGCGGGQWLARLAALGYAPIGVDVSEAMIRAAGQLVPAAELHHGSFASLKLPTCEAVTSLGEPLNYLPSAAGVRRTLRNVYRALRPGGLFVFDVRTPSTKPVAPRTVARVGDDWACIARIEEDGAQLTRRITTFRQSGRSYRRGEETHVLRLYPQAEIAGWLRDLGFRVRTKRGYGDYRLAPRQVVFVAQK
jgi:SAM-dependent methyltransferase